MQKTSKNKKIFALALICASLSFSSSHKLNDFHKFNLINSNYYNFSKQIPLSDSSFSRKKSYPTKDDSTNNYHLYINLPEFKSRLYENDVLVDSAIISPGAYYRRSPVFKTEQNLITLRPSFYPTDAERHQFRSNPPDKTNSPKKPKNALGRFRIVLKNTLRAHGTSQINSIAKFDEHGHVKNGHAKSNGFIRHDNEAGARLVARIIKGSSIQKIQGAQKDSVWTLINNLKSNKLTICDFISKTPAGKAHDVTLESAIKITISYALWSDQIYQNDTSFYMFVYPDIYGYTKNRAPPQKVPFDANLSENRFTKEHLTQTLIKNNLDTLDHNIYSIDSIYTKIKSICSKIKTPTHLQISTARKVVRSNISH